MSPILEIKASTENRMCEWIAFRLYGPTLINKRLRMLRSINGIEQYVKISTHRILHADRHGQSAGKKAMQLVFHGTCTDCNVDKQIHNIRNALRIKQFVHREKASLADNRQMHFTSSDKT